MPVILPVLDKTPQWGDNCFIAPNATIVGDVKLGNNCSVWFNAVIRGDVNTISIGDDSNIQDGAVIHATYQKADTFIGNRVSVGHNAIVHGCTLKDHILIGMGAIVMDNAIVEDYCIIAAGSVVLERTLCETPAKKIKPITEEQRALLNKLPDNYIMYSDWFR
jgi:carbonic anhydrase/acetyltransferase-like protein (isoleucine patch superfamily)